MQHAQQVEQVAEWDLPAKGIGMSEDIVERLRSLRHIHLPQLSEEAAAEIERLRQVSSKKNITDAEWSEITEASEFYIGTRTGLALSGLLSRTGSDLRQTRDSAPECGSQGEKLPERDRLTDAEREAVEYFAAFHRSPREGDAAAAATLRGLLERLGGER